MASPRYERLKADYFRLLEQTDSTPIIDWSDRSSGPIRIEQIEDAIIILRYRLAKAATGTHYASRVVIDLNDASLPVRHRSRR